jgi:hypothetical protein
MSILYTPVDTTKSTSASSLDVLLNKYAGGELTTQLYDKRDNFNFARPREDPG